MFREFFRFELRGHLRRPSLYLCFAVSFAIGVWALLSQSGYFPGGGISLAGAGRGEVHADAPLALFLIITFCNLAGLLITAGVMGHAGYRDYERNVSPIVLTCPIRPSVMLLGRFTAGVVTLLAVFLGVGLGLLAGRLWPDADPAAFGPLRLSAYFQPYLVSVLPNLLVAGSLFFGLATWRRQRLPVYAACAFLVMSYVLALPLAGSAHSRTLAGLLDPFGITASMQGAAQYWTVDQRNANLVPLTGIYLWNRLLWCGIGLFVLGLAIVRFRVDAAIGRRRHSGTEQTTTAQATPAAAVSIPTVHRRFGVAESLGQWWSLTRVEFTSTVLNVYFLVTVLLGALFTLVVGFRTIGQMYDTTTWPVTYVVVEGVKDLFSVFVLAVIMYSGELVWRDRDRRLAPITDALPIPDWVPFCAKLGALSGALALMQTVVLLCGLVVQAGSGYFRFDPGVYAVGLFVDRLPVYITFCAGGLLVHVLVNNKYAGYVVLTVGFVLMNLMGKLGVEHTLLRFSETSGLVYSDMNGYGPYLPGFAWFRLYWTAFAVLLVVATLLFWVRGNETGWRGRLRLARARFRSPLTTVGLGALVVFSGSAAWIFYNTDIRNEFQTKWQQESARVAYERQYRRFLSVPQPTVTAVSVRMELYPAERRLWARAVLQVQNKHDGPVSEIALTIPAGVTMERLAIRRLGRVTRDDRTLHFQVYRFDQPLPPGETLEIEVEVSASPRGFQNKTPPGLVRENGTFFDATAVFPNVGYYAPLELTAADRRKKHGLPPAPASDPDARAQAESGARVGLVDYEAVIGTADDQTAITAGRLVGSWREKGRRYFHYRMDRPMRYGIPFLSARYEVKRVDWRGVTAEVYYHPAHAFNVALMMDAATATLDYCTRSFGPYQFEEVRVAEFPRYGSNAQSFPGTITYSESLGFIARVESGGNAVPYPFQVTAHEVAHQWWGHQVRGARGPGSDLISESMAQYVSLQVLRQQRGDAVARRFLTAEMDTYLRSRSRATMREQPLARGEDQDYVSYQKGAIVLDLLRQLIGERRLNEALARCLREHASRQSPALDAAGFLTYLRQVTPPDLQYVITDSFERITLYDLRALGAESRRRADGRYDVTLRVAARKVQCDGTGTESEAPMDDYLDVGVLDASGRVLVLERKRFGAQSTEFTFVVDREPATAGIDPFHLFIDRNPGDNTAAVTRASSRPTPGVPGRGAAPTPPDPSS
jgi:ABC-2 type transport system permease protein